MSNESLKGRLAEQKKGGVATLGDFLMKNRGRIASVMPAHFKERVDRQIRLAEVAVGGNDQLAKCSAVSVYAGVIKASMMGLEIGVQGQGYLVPYWNSKSGKYEAQFIPGWQGYADLLARGGRATAWTGAVFEGDEFEYQLGARPDVQHKPGGESDPNKLLFVYAIGWVKDADWPVIDVWPMRRVLIHRDQMNKVGTKHYSYKALEMYARKLPFLQIIKYLPKSVELTTALQKDPEAHTGNTFEGEYAQVPPVMDDDVPPPQDAPPESEGQPGPEPEPQQEKAKGKPMPEKSEPEPTKQEPAKEAHPSDNDEPPPGVGRVVDDPKQGQPAGKRPRGGMGLS